MLDADGNRAMRIETIVGWRDTHYPGDVCDTVRGGSPFMIAAAASRALRLFCFPLSLFLFFPACLVAGRATIHHPILTIKIRSRFLCW